MINRYPCIQIITPAGTSRIAEIDGVKVENISFYLLKKFIAEGVRVVFAGTGSEGCIKSDIFTFAYYESEEAEINAFFQSGDWEESLNKKRYLEKKDE